ncbi:hypothetical protein BGX38DRAFT_1269520 [Terfezia claveryi]|nr:hypothetical protein BGX38DRAFT_1269520 [Terfezia claveryi]
MAKPSVSSRLPVLRKPSGAQTSKQITSGEASPRGAAHPPSATPKAPLIVKRNTSLKAAKGTNGLSASLGNTIGSTRAAELRRASATKSDPLASTPEEGAPEADSSSPTPSLSSCSSKDQLKSVKEQRRASSVYVPSSLIQRKGSSSQLEAPTVNRRASASQLPTLSSLSKKVSSSSLTKKPSTSQLASSATSVSKRPSINDLKTLTTIAKKASAPQLNRRVSNSTLSLPLNKNNTSPGSLCKAPSSSSLKSPAPPQTPTTPTTPISTRPNSKPTGRLASGPQTPKATPRATPKASIRPSSSSTTASTDADSPKRPKGNQSQSLRDAIAKARAAKAASLQQGSVGTVGSGDHNSFDTIDPFNIGAGGTTELQRKIKTARSEGRLNIAMMDLKEIPKQVYEMYDMKGEDMDGGDNGPKWYENVDLVRLIAADNDIQEVGEQLAQVFQGLTAIDMHNNIVHALPENLATLTNLTTLNLINNKLGHEALELICEITTLLDLKIGKNAIEGDLTPLIENLTKLEVLELQENKITSLPNSIEYLSRLRNLDLSNNSLTEIPFRLLRECSLAELNLSHNRIRGTLIESEVGELRFLQLLDIRSNRISILSEGSVSMPALKNLLASNNELSIFPAMDGWTELLTFIVEHNRMEELPKGLTSLPKLRVLDLTANNFSSFDPTLGTMESLEVLKLDGNPFRERNLLGMSLVDLKRTLKGRLAPPAVTLADSTVDTRSTEDDEGEEVEDEVIELRPGGVLDLSKREMDFIPRDLLECVTPAPLSIEAHHNLLLAIPQSIEMFTASLTTVNLSHNKMPGDSYLPKKISLRWLTTLSINNNSITSIKPLLDNLDAPRLEQLDLATNKIKDIAGLRPTFPQLTRLYARDNLIEEIPVETVDGMKVLDLVGNSIAALPPKLGLVTTLRELRVEGNCFRVPRWQVLEKGTESVLLWLRDKLPPDDTNTEDGFVSALED